MGSIITMHPALLQSSHSVHSDYTFEPEQGYMQQLGAHAHHSSNPSAKNAADLLRYGDSLGQASQSVYSLHPSDAALYVSDRTAADGGYTTSTATLSDNHSGSISTSPSSAASSLQYNSYSTNHFSGLTTLPSTQHSLVPHPHAFAQHMGVGLRMPSTLDGSLAGFRPLHIPAHNSQVFPQVNTASRDTYTHSAAHTPHGYFTSPQPFATYSETPRHSLIAPIQSLAPGPPGAFAAQMASSVGQGYGTHLNESHNFPWPTLEIHCGPDLTCGGQVLTPEIFAKMEKGFFVSPTDRSWTCYRRNYFSVVCNFELHPHIANGRLLLRGRPVQAMGMRLAAAVDAPAGKQIELIQHTPKRDAGPKGAVEIQRVAPSPPANRAVEHSTGHRGAYHVPVNAYHHTGAFPSPYLPLQSVGDMPAQASSSTASSSQSSTPAGYGYSTAQLPISGQNVSHTFERVQFKSATANNGKRRASQQYFHLIVELFVDIRADGASQPDWHKVAARISEKIVVRGRSPSHYQNEGQAAGPSARGASATRDSSAPPVYGASAGTYGSASGYGGGGASKSATHWGSRNQGIKQSSPPDSVSPSITSSSSGPGIQPKLEQEQDQDMAMAMDHNDDAQMRDYQSYEYLPSAIYDGVPMYTKIEDSPIQAHDLRRMATSEEYPAAEPGPDWGMTGFSRYQGLQSSRGFYLGKPHPVYS